mmetsp:Transcript_106333/g.297667  ORF Transcript_106333/g.297667 Transcript_106333/m.297667 type:complete len:414 (-) Transcript_106333:123-1364(-)
MLSTSFSNVPARLLCCFSKSVCFFVRSSALTMPLFKTSRSLRMSWIVFASASTCFLTRSISRIKFSVSVFNTARCNSKLVLSSSSSTRRLFNWSTCFCNLSLSACQFLISSCLALSNLFCSMLSSCMILLLSSSSLLERFKSSISLTNFVCASVIPSTMRFCSFNAFSKPSFVSSCPRMSFRMFRKVLSRPSKVCLSSSSSFSKRSLRRSSRSASVRFAFKESLTLAISEALWTFSDSCFCTCSVKLMFSCVNLRTCASSLSRVFFKSSRWEIRLLTVFSWVTLKPAPCSTRWLRFAISNFKLWIVSFARCSFSCEASTIFHARSISFFKLPIVAWSSLERFKAVCTLAAFETISELRSRHFLMRRFSLSCDFFKARCNFSYSNLKCSNDLSPMSSCNTSWKSFSNASKALDS